MADTYLLAGGGTAGHVNPLLATAARLVERGHRVEVLGTAEGLEQDLVPRAGLTLHDIPRVPFPRRPSAAALRFPRQFLRAVSAVREIIDATNADAVVGFGGYVATPAYLAARRARVAMVVHEANAKPGLANKVGARLGATVAAAFEGTGLDGAQVIGMPLDERITTVATTLADPDRAPQVRADAKATFGWDAGDPVVLVTGGSLGAASLNAAVAGAVDALTTDGVSIIHLTGRGKSEQALAIRDALAPDIQVRYQVHEYSHDMVTCLTAADAVVCRAGASTVSEITAMGLPALYVPLPHGNGEQALNVAAVRQAGAATVIDDAALSAEALAVAVRAMVLDQQTQQSMSDAARATGIADGASRLADLIEQAVR